MTPLEHLQWLLERAVRAMRRRIDYSTLYAGTVVAQNGDGSLEVTSSVPRRPHLSRVPIQYGVPGITANVNNGGAVLLGFTGADPSLPYVLIYDRATVKSLSLLGGTQPIARLGDGVQVPFPSTAMYTGSFGIDALAGAPVTMSSPFVGTIESGQDGALA